MSDIQFPSRLKPIVTQGYGHRTGGNILSVNPQGGLSRQSRDTYYDTIPISVVLIVNAIGRRVFKEFLRRINNGADKFLMDNDTGNGVEQHLVQIQDGSVNETTQNGQWWNITFTAVAERTSVQDQSDFGDAIYGLYDAYGDGLQQFLNLYEQYVTTPNFINNLPEPL
jgi:hypothetical protein